MACWGGDTRERNEYSRSGAGCAGQSDAWEDLAAVFESEI